MNLKMNYETDWKKIDVLLICEKFVHNNIRWSGHDWGTLNVQQGKLNENGTLIWIFNEILG